MVSGHVLVDLLVCFWSVWPHQEGSGLHVYMLTSCRRGYSGFLPLSKNMQVKQTEDMELSRTEDNGCIKKVAGSIPITATLLLDH